MATPAPALRPLQVGEILDVAIKIYTRNALTFFKIVAVVIAPVQAIGVIALASTLPEGVGFSPNFSVPEPGNELTVDTGDLWAWIVANVTIGLLTFIAASLATAACYKAITEAYVGDTPDWKDSLRFARSRLHSLIWVTFLQTLLPGLGLILCIVPGVYLWVSWSVAAPALMTEGVKGRRSLSRSGQLVKTRWWPVFGVQALGFVLASVLSGLISVLFIGVLFTDIGDNVLVSLVINGVATTISGVLVTPFQAAIVTVLYFDLRVRKEGFDLELLASRLGVQGSAESWPALLPTPPLPQSAQPPFWPPPPGWQPPPGQPPPVPPGAYPPGNPPQPTQHPYRPPPSDSKPPES